MKVLIADDDPVSRRLLQNYLEKWEYEVTVAMDGSEAWQCFQQDDFSLVICDWMMPGIDGPDLIRRIRASSPHGYVYTLLLTAKTKKGDLVEGMESGADDFVSKPFNHDELHVRLRAGERIIKLERSLREAQEALRESQSE
ncbi:MAG: PleD family two-component system response regulator [Novipirellula sp. JB048]